MQMWLKLQQDETDIQLHDGLIFPSSVSNLNSLSGKMNGKCSPRMTHPSGGSEKEQDVLLGGGCTFLPKCHGRPPKYVTLR